MNNPISPSPHPLRWLAAAVMILGVLMDLIDATIVNVALPTIRADLHASGTALEWVTAAYMLGFATVLIAAGSLGDLAGRKRVFLAGTALFALASLASGIATTPGQLIAARAVQGVAAGVMTPQLLATFRAIFSGAELGQAFGFYGMMAGFAVAIGLLAGGALTTANLFGWHWRTVFLVNLPLALVTLVAGARVIPETRGTSGRRPDLLGAAMLALALLAVSYPIVEGRVNGWPWWGWVVLAGGVATLGALVNRQRRLRAGIAPLLHLQGFRVPAFSAGLAVQFVFSVGLQGFFLVFALWVQSGQGYSPLRAGLTTVAFSVGSFILAPMAIPLAVRRGRIVLAIGGVLMAAGLIAVDVGAHHVGRSTDPWPLVPGLVVAGAGLALLVIPLANVVLAAVPASVGGSASGVFATVQQLGGAIGIAALGSVFFGAVPAHGFHAAFQRVAPATAGLFLVAAVIAMALPPRALDEEQALAMEGASAS